MDKYQIRHKTLDILASKAYYALYENEESKNLNPVSTKYFEVKVQDLIEKLNVTEFEFRLANNPVAYAKEIKYDLSYYDGEEVLFIEAEGLVAFESNKYLNQRFNEKNDKVYSVTKWVLPIVALIVSVVALIISLMK